MPLSNEELRRAIETILSTTDYLERCADYSVRHHLDKLMNEQICRAEKRETRDMVSED